MRLIDAETFSEAMKAYFINKIENHEAEVDVVDCNAELQKILSEQPTAFDVDKVLETIAEKREYYYLNDDVFDPISVDALDFAADTIDNERKAPTP